MKIELRYFTGTGNSWKVLDICRDVFVENHHTASITKIKNNEQFLSDADLIGFRFPVYVFGILRICRRYLNKLQSFSKSQDVFVIITAGKQDEAGFSVGQYTKILKKKNCRIIYSAPLSRESFAWASQAAEQNESSSQPAKQGKQGMATRCNRAATGGSV